MPLPPMTRVMGTPGTPIAWPIAAGFMVAALILFFLPALLPLLARIRRRVAPQKA